MIRRSKINERLADMNPVGILLHDSVSPDKKIHETSNYNQIEIHIKSNTWCMMNT